MYTLKVYPYICNGLVSCGLCNEILPGFLTEHCGELLIAEGFLIENLPNITEALNACPTEALQLDEMS